MSRFLLFTLGVLSAFAAWTLTREQPPSAEKGMAARQAAEQLRQAWADHHTQA